MFQRKSYLPQSIPESPLLLGNVAQLHLVFPLYLTLLYNPVVFGFRKYFYYQAINFIKKFFKSHDDYTCVDIQNKICTYTPIPIIKSPMHIFIIIKKSGVPNSIQIFFIGTVVYVLYML